jgi:hypothetical protein
MYKNIYKYFAWYDKPAVLVENFNESYQGYYWEGWKWHEANTTQVDDFVVNKELSNEEFIKKFGRIRLWLLRGQTAHISGMGGS